jgi:hypothetical protein
MNQFFIQTKLLLSGQAAPFTGSVENMARSRDAAFTVYSSGSGIVKLQYNSPFFENEWVDFYQFTGLRTGYSTPAYLTTPMINVRAISSGIGNFWVSFTAQN